MLKLRIETFLGERILSPQELVLLKRSVEEGGFVGLHLCNAVDGPTALVGDQLIFMLLEVRVGPSEDNFMFMGFFLNPLWTAEVESENKGHQQLFDLEAAWIEQDDKRRSQQAQAREDSRLLNILFVGLLLSAALLLILSRMQFQ